METALVRKLVNAVSIKGLDSRSFQRRRMADIHATSVPLRLNETIEELGTLMKLARGNDGVTDLWAFLRV